MSIREWIDLIKLNIEDGSFHPQFIQALPKKLVYTYLSIVKDSTIIRAEEQLLDMPGKSPYIYTLRCIEMEDVPANLCPCVPPRGCQWRRSKKPLPNFIGNKLDLLTETTLDGIDLEYNYIDPSEVSSYGSSRYNNFSKKYTIIDLNNDDYVYILSGKGRSSKFLMARTPFTDLIKIVEFNDCFNNDLCNFLETDFGIDSRYEAIVLSSVTQMIAGFLSVNQVADTRDDGLDGSVMRGDT